MDDMSKTTLWMETHAGKRLSLPVTPEMLDIEDISHALSFQCRYAGHTNRFYSVAEHCCLVSDYVFRHTKDARHALAALLHDASEAYLVDIPKPIKPYLANYAELEQQIEIEVAKKWNVDYPWSALIKQADCRILIDERRELFHDTGFDWGLPVDEALGVQVEGLEPRFAKAQFLERFHDYAK